ncbi:MAG: insulinase family protein [Gammaproteobacteria bacterium]|nr:insulinase family protein [Gammaproteobacteria bacterium]MDH5802140.1 insulinase family protein [Gammaproteobacteria bacterium]
MNRRLQALSGAALAFIVAGCVSTPTQQTQSQPQAQAATTNYRPGDVVEFKLDNGLKILVKPDHRAPVVVSQVWYKAGSSYETNGSTGVAHVLEHMMFKGTDKLGPNEFSKIISANGGRENAFTGQDYTAYFQQLEKSRLKISFELEADRMQNLNLSAEEFGKEIKVVMEERRMRTEDNPQSLTYEQFNATAFMTSPYHHPVIGWMDDLQNMEVADAQLWYNNWYAPNNATVVVVGDVEPQEVLQLAQKYFGPVKPRAVPKLKQQVEAEQKGQRRVTVKAPAQLPYLLMGFKVPVVKTSQSEWEPYALEMLAYVLDGSNSARFAKHLVRGSEVAAGVSAGYDLYSRMGDLFTISGMPAQGKDVATLEKAIMEQIDKLKTEPVTAEELQRIKTQVVASKVYEKDSVFYQAMQIGTLETVGLDWRLMDQYTDRFRAVTAEQVQQVAKKYLIDQYLTVAILDPQPIDNTKMPRHSMGGRHGR